MSLRLFGEDLTVAAREQSRKKKLTPGAEAMTTDEPKDPEDDKNGDAEESDDDGAKEHE